MSPSRHEFLPNEDCHELSRRGFLRSAGAVSGAAVIVTASAPFDARAEQQSQASAVAGAETSTLAPKLPMRTLGQTGARVSILGLGGGGRGANPQVRGTPNRPDVRERAEQILNRALDAGVNYIDTCTGYGESESIIGNIAATRRREMFLATKCDRCNASGDQLRKELEQSLRQLRTDTIDLWQIHNIRNLQDVAAIFRKDGAVDVFSKAREEGIVRFIGITAHISRTVIEATLDRCRQTGITMDTLLFSFNVADAASGGHGRRILDAQPEMGRIAMKVFGSDGAPIIGREDISAEKALRYVLSHDFSTAIVGIHTLEELEENIRIARGFQPLDEFERQAIEQRLEGQGQKLWTLHA